MWSVDEELGAAEHVPGVDGFDLNIVVYELVSDPDVLELADLPFGQRVMDEPGFWRGPFEPLVPEPVRMVCVGMRDEDWCRVRDSFEALRVDQNCGFAGSDDEPVEPAYPFAFATAAQCLQCCSPSVRLVPQKRFPAFGPRPGAGRFLP